MNRYENSIPRAACGIAAAAMTAMTIGLFVVAPAKIGSGNQQVRVLAATKTVIPSSSVAVISPLRIGVVAVHEPNLVSVQVRGLLIRRS